VRLQQRGPQEQRIKIKPDIPVIPRPKVEVPALGTSKPDHPGIHHAMVARQHHFGNPGRDNPGKTASDQLPQ
jgi:hypothetical protein